MTKVQFRDLHPTTRRLLMIRTLRSIGQGALVVDFTFYLHALNWSAVSIGLLLSAGSLFAALLTLIVGLTSDRIRRKPILIVYEIVTLVSGLALIISSQNWILVVAAVLGGFGRGANGAAGPFSPAEQAWLAEEIAPKERGQVYSLNSALGFFGMGLGAFFAIMPVVWASTLPGAMAYRPLFGLIAGAALAGLLILWGAEETRRFSNPVKDEPQTQEENFVRRHENQVLAKLVLINAFNGLAVGLTGPLMSYWFLHKFGVGPEAIAPVMGMTFIITGIFSLYTGALTERIGIISSVVEERLIGLILLAALPFMPSYPSASLLYLLRSVFTRGSAGAQQALTIGLVRDERRGLAISLNTISNQVPRSAGPGITAYFIGLGQFNLPFYIATVFQGIYLLLYYVMFKKCETDQEN